MPSGPALAVPANNNFADAIAITTPAVSGIVAVGDNFGATTEAGEPGPCSISGTTWYTWTSPVSPGTVVFDTYGSDFDTALGIYTGDAVNALFGAGCNDDFDYGGAGRQSALTLSYAASTTYRIQVGGFGANTGNFVLNMATGSDIFVTTTADNTTSDSNMTAREAILLARGGTGAGGLNRALSADESLRVLNAGAAGTSGSDLIHFSPSIFPPGAPATIALSTTLPDLNATGDTVSGIGAGVIVDGVTIWYCFVVSGTSNGIEGIRMIRCGTYGILITGAANVIGGSLSGQRNVIGQSASYIGIEISGASAIGNKIKGNYIGTDATGTAASALNTGISIDGAQSTLVGGSGPVDGNLISGNAGSGIVITGSDFNVVQGNKIGTNVASTGALANGINGVRINAGAQGNIIGGTGAGEGNIIAFNAGSGVSILSDGTATVRGNSIHSNGGGISSASLAAPGITSALGGTVAGTACALCIVDVYDDSATQGKIYRASTNADAAGNFSVAGVSHTLANFTATNTNANGLTSAFSVAVAAPLNADGDGLADSSDPCPLVAEDYDGYQDGDGCPDTDNDLDGICDPGLASVSCSGSDSGKMCFDPAATLSCPTQDCRNIAEDYDAFKDSDGCPEPDNDNDGFPDAADGCPGVSAKAGADGMLGSPEDLNHNGIRDDPPESPLTTDDVVLVFEDYDGILDGDGCHDSPGEDFDGDGFTDELEALAIGTNPGRGCAATATANDEDPDPFPSDADDNQRVNIGDVIILFSGKILNPPAYTPRSDFDDNDAINIGDVIIGFSVKAHIFDECAAGPGP